MATPDAVSTLQDTVNSLDMNEVPNKLKCAICSKLALNAFKLPCCAQSICESCQSALEGTCPVCEHSPLSPDLCAPHKALRNTIKAYLKTAEKKLAEESGRGQKTGASQPDIATAQDVPLSKTPEIKREGSIDQTNGGPGGGVLQGGQERAESVSIAPDDPQPSIEFPEDAQPILSGDQSTEPVVDAQTVEAPDQRTNGSAPQHQDPSRTESIAPESAKSPENYMGQNESGFGMHGTGMPNMMNMNIGMGSNMDFNPMMQMQFMSNGMMNGMNNMMGMPGMGMDPMTQGMFGAFGQGMGMNGMNMGFDPSGGQGMFGGWNNQTNPSWNGQQGNHTNGFGNNMGYGFNVNHRGNFQQNQYPYNDFQPGHRGYGYRGGRGRGRGAYGWRGHGGYGASTQSDHSNYQQQAYQQHPEQQQLYHQSTDAVTSGDPSNGQIEETPMTEEERMKQMDAEFAPGDEEETNEALAPEGDDVAHDKVPAQGETEIEDVPAKQAVNESRSPNHDQTGDEMGNKDDMTQSIPVLTSEQDATPVDVGMNNNAAVAPLTQSRSLAMPPPSAPTGPAAHFGHAQAGFGFRGRGYGRFPTRRGGGFGFVNAPPQGAPTEPKGQGVTGAPTGPKALRKDVEPPTGPRGSTNGLQIIGRASMTAQPQSPKVDQPESEQVYDGGEDHDPRDRSRSRSRSPSGSHSRHRSHRHHRRRESLGASDAEHVSSSRRDYHRKSSRHDEAVDETVNGDYEKRSRASTPNSPRKESRRHRDKDYQSSRHKHRSSHRSRHDHDDEMVDSHEDGHESSHHQRSRTSKHGSSLEDGRERSHHRHRDRDRDHEKHESRRHEDHHRDRKRSRREYDEIEDDQHENGSSHRSRRAKYDKIEDTNGTSRSLPPPTPVEPMKDPHTLEREARNRERMLKEQQRRDAMNSERSSQGRRDTRLDRGHGGRRVSYKYEDETNAARGEREREAARWS